MDFFLNIFILFLLREEHETASVCLRALALESSKKMCVANDEQFMQLMVSEQWRTINHIFRANKINCRFVVSFSFHFIRMYQLAIERQWFLCVDCKRCVRQFDTVELEWTENG